MSVQKDAEGSRGMHIHGKEALGQQCLEEGLHIDIQQMSQVRLGCVA